MSAAHSTGSPGLDRTPSLKKRQMDENTKVGKDDFSVAAVGDQLKSLLVFVSTTLPTSCICTIDAPNPSYLSL